MSDLLLDLDGLTGLYQDLMAVSRAFGNIDCNSQIVADAVGHDGLAGRVNEFADKWDDRRKTAIESLDALWKQAQGIVDTFTDVDLQLASSLTEGA